MVECFARPERSVAETAIEYFDAINLVPVASRADYLREPLFSSLLVPLLSHAQYPEGFAGWESCTEDDPEAFHRFR